MSKKARASAVDEVQPMTGGILESFLVLGAAIVVALVALWFELDVNRVFDVPKATALKMGGCGIFLVWLGVAVFGRGFPWRSMRIFGAPVAALTSVVLISTALSIDVPTSLYGVYERQFGLQGFLGCVGIFVVASTCLRSQRGALAALAWVAVIGGVVGYYSLLQAKGVDPFGFFKSPFNKVYSTLGNATFAGNALALIFPVSLVLSIVAIFRVTSRRHLEPAGMSPNQAIVLVVLGALAVAFLEVVPGWRAAVGSSSDETKESIFKLGVGLALTFIVAAAALGTYGPTWLRSTSVRFCRMADALGAGGLAASAFGIALGINFTRTRGAWVGTAAAMLAGPLLLPLLFRDRRELFRRLLLGGLIAAGALVVGVTSFVVLFPNNLYSVTIRSIPYAFENEHAVYGKGQGTRKYLWSESPRVLFEHDLTLQRQYEDLAEYAKKVKNGVIGDVDFEELPPKTDAERASDTAWRRVVVWIFGIGIETYRYAFMSHKSKKLEALDPMTNHDNPHNNYLYVLASFGITGLLAYLWLLQRLLFTAFNRFNHVGPRSGEHGPEGSADAFAENREARAIAFGVVLSFFSYTVYSIAGFDSVACSAFLYLLLGAAAVFFAPQVEDPPRSLWVNIRRQWAEFRGRDPGTVPAHAPFAAGLATFVLLGGLLAHSMWGGARVYNAERAFVGDPRSRDPRARLEDMKRAIRINPNESFYKQNLGSSFADIARVYRAQAARVAAQGDSQGDSKIAAEYAKEGEKYAHQAEVVLYAALDHAWAPENIFISLFQLYYSAHQFTEAEYALKRGLGHSPHLGAVRANLAILELERGALDAAMADCQWVLEVEAENEIALRTCGRASYLQGNLASAKRYLDQAIQYSPRDGVAKSYLADVTKAMAAATSSGAHAG